MLYKRIKELRKEEKKTQADMGAVLGMSQRAYGHYENGDRDMSPEVLIALADYYDVSIDYLLGRTNKRNLKK
ncbi:helix-turn-helix domain-containing protein [Neglectibacter caecimuris]|uniref:helix-turn-helix domain-containing protein n=1 Tax=Neglectibacter caecimuris TaxID=3093658 RepID=UPI002AC8A737|nr:helix-turn-helix transcriptional regulator [Neglectibacter sp. M00184]